MDDTDRPRGATTPRGRGTEQASSSSHPNTPHRPQQDYRWLDTVIDQQEDPLTLALRLARAGVRVLPAVFIELDPTRATDDEDMIRLLWQRYPQSPVAFALPGLGLYVPHPSTEGQLLPKRVNVELSHVLAKVGAIVWGENTQGGYDETCTLIVSMALVTVDDAFYSKS
jgi:hypothetical protein